MDKIHISEIACLAHLGVPPQERENPQEILVDVVLSINLEQAVHSDEVTSTVDYVGIVEKVKDTLKERHFCLLESVAGHLCRSILTDTKIKFVQVKVRKFPEVLREQVRYVEVEMTRSQP